MFTFDLVETLEYFSLFIDRNTYTGITDLQHQIIIFFLQRDSNALAAFCIFESIRKQVVYYQFQIIRIEKYLFIFQIGMESISYLFVACQFIIKQKIFLYQLVSVRFLGFQFEYSEFGTAIIHQLIDKV